MNEKGYTLLEALFQVVVFVILSHVFILIMLWYSEMKSTVFAVEQTKWELFVYDVNTYFVDVVSEYHSIMRIKTCDKITKTTT